MAGFTFKLDLLRRLGRISFGAKMPSNILDEAIERLQWDFAVVFQSRSTVRSVSRLFPSR
jgi:hypothetical protein